MNSLLEKECINNNLLFINVHELYADENGMLPVHLGDWDDGHGVHIKATDRLRTHLKNNNLI